MRSSILIVLSACLGNVVDAIIVGNLIAYAIEAVLIFLCHKVGHVKFEFGGSKSE